MSAVQVSDYVGLPDLVPDGLKVIWRATTAFAAATAQVSVLLSWVVVAIILMPVFEIFQWLSDLLFL